MLWLVKPWYAEAKKESRQHLRPCLLSVLAQRTSVFFTLVYCELLIVIGHLCSTFSRICDYLAQVTTPVKDVKDLSITTPTKAGQ